MVLRASSLPTAPSVALQNSPVIAVLRAQRAQDYFPVVEVLAATGVRSIELTLSTPGTIDLLRHLRSIVPREVDLGVGTITDEAQAQEAIDAGADFLVTPTMNIAVVEIALTRSIPIYPGGLTPTELFQGWAAGATAVKVFPAATVGADYLSHLRGPFPDIQVIPSGGVGVDDALEWLKAGALAVSIGGPLIGDALRGGSLTALEHRTRLVLDMLNTARGEK